MVNVKAINKNQPHQGNDSRQGRDKSSLSLSLFLFLTVFSSYAVTFHGIFILHSEPLRWILAILNGFFIVLLAIIGHDTAHQSFFPNKRLNDTLGRIAFLPGYIPFMTWSYEHHTQHHRYTNWAEKDITWNPFSYESFLKLPRWRQFFERVYRTPLGTGLYWIREFWWKRHMMPEPYIRDQMKKKAFWAAHQRDVMGVWLFLAAQFLYVFYLSEKFSGGHPGFIVYFYRIAMTMLIPHLIFTWLAGLLIFVQHTSPKMVWYNCESEWKQFGNQSLMATHVIMPSFSDKLLLHITSHSAHHTNQNIPVYRLPFRQKELEDTYKDQMGVDHFSIAWLIQLFRTCQLYDFDKHQWLDFQGRPTTPAMNLNQLFPSSRNARAAA